jgi:hypothetical protein
MPRELGIRTVDLSLPYPAGAPPILFGMRAGWTRGRVITHARWRLRRCHLCSSRIAAWFGRIGPSGTRNLRLHSSMYCAMIVVLRHGRQPYALTLSESHETGRNPVMQRQDASREDRMVLTSIGAKPCPRLRPAF